MNNMIWDAVLWLRRKLSKDKEDIIVAVNNIQNLFETSADATASPSDILAGKTAYNGTVLLTGAMKDRRGITVTAGTTTQDDEYTYLSIPEEACFNSNSKVRTKNSNIYQKVIYAAGHAVNPTTTEITVPANVKSGLLIATGYTYNSNSEKTSFSVSGEGLQNAEEILYNYAPYSQSGALSIYKCKLTPGKKIAVTFTNTGYGTCSLNVALLHS